MASEPTDQVSVEEVVKELNSVREEYVRLQDHLADIELKYQSALSNEKEGTEGQFSTELQTIVANLFNCEKYSDLQVLLEHGRIFYGHKLILAARSIYWGVADLSLAPSIDLKHVNYDVSMAVLKWIYTDEIDIENVSVDFLMELLKVASKFHLEALFTRSQKTLITRITEDNCQKLYRLANELPSTTLKNNCLEYMTRGKDGVVIVTDDPTSDTPIKTSSTDQLDCDVCNKSFNTSAKLKRHLLTHTGEKPYKCHVCGKGVTEKSTLKKHVRSQHPDQVENLQEIEDESPRWEKVAKNEVKCYACDKSFYSERQLKRHINSLHKVQFECETCRTMFDTERKLKLHQVSHEKEILCEKCQKNFDTEQKLRRHILFHHKNDFSCNICDEVFDTHQKLRQHFVTHKDKVPFKCHLCIKIFPMEDEFKNHLQSVHNVEKPDYFCSICNKPYYDKANLKSHESLHDTDEIDHICKYCGRDCQNQSKFLKHMLTHLGIQPFPCRHCPKSFNTQSSLDRHNRSYHADVEGVEPMISKRKPKVENKCSYCSETFNSRKLLKEHERKHTGEKPFECDVCGSKFRLLDSYRSHVKIHKGKPHMCDVCGACFVLKSQLTRHRRKHTGETPFKCKLCPREFKYYNSLKIHMASHTGYRPLVCETCGKGCATQSDFKRHLKVHTNDRPHKCDVCHKKNLKVLTQ